MLYRFALIAALVMMGGPGSAQSLADKFHQQLQSCRNFMTGETRLSCYDNANRQYIDRVLSKESEKEDKAAISEIWVSYKMARVSGDADAWLALWDADGIRMAPGEPAVDYAAFSKSIPTAFANSQPLSMDIIPDEIVIMGDWAYSRGNFTVGKEVDGKFLTIFRRQDDGSWRIYRDAFNMNTR